MGGSSKKKSGKSQKKQQQAGSSAAAQHSSSADAGAADHAFSCITFGEDAALLSRASAAALLKGGRVEALLQEKEEDEKILMQLEQQQQLPEYEQQQETQQQQQQESNGSRVAPTSMERPAALVISQLQPMLQKLFAARKRARDWKSPELSSRVCCALAAFEVALDLLLRIPGAHDMHEVTAVIEELGRSALLQQTASAHGELAQLLHALLLLQLQQLAHELLNCWLPLRELVLWGDEFAASRQAPVSAVATAGFLLGALELAAVLAQSLNADSPPQTL